MGVAKEKIAEAKKIAEDAALRDKVVLDKSMAINAAIPDLWERLMRHMEEGLAEFIKQFPSRELAAHRLNQNNFTIQNKAFPLVKLEVVRDGSYLAVYQETQLSGLRDPVARENNNIRFDADGSRVPCFSDSQKYYSPETLGDELLAPILDFLIKTAGKNSLGL